MTIDRDQFKALATQFRDLQDSNKLSVDKFMEKVEAEGIDRGGLRRFVTWKRKDETKRAQQDAIDQQCRYLAGERDTPAELPVGCELAQAINLFRRNMTVRQVVDEMHISLGKASKLRQLARMFDVHVHDRVNKRRGSPKVDVITPPEAAALPGPRDAKGNPLQADADGVVVETAGPEQGASGSSPTPDDAPQAERIEEPPATPTAAVGAVDGTNSDVGIPMSTESCGETDADVRPVQEVAADGGVLAREEAADGSGICLQAVPAGMAQGSPHESRETPRPIAREEDSPRSRSGCREMGADHEADALREVSGGDAAAPAGRTSPRLQQAIGSQMALPAVSRAGSTNMAGSGVAPGPESCGGLETAQTTSPAQGPVVSEPDETRPAVAGCASGTSHAQGNRPAEVALSPQDPINQGDDNGPDEAVLHGVGGSLHAERQPAGHRGDGANVPRLDDGQTHTEGEEGQQAALTPEPEVARVATPATDPDDDLAFPDFLDRRAIVRPQVPGPIPSK